MSNEVDQLYEEIVECLDLVFLLLSLAFVVSLLTLLVFEKSKANQIDLIGGLQFCST